MKLPPTNPYHVLTQKEIAEKTYLSINTIQRTEQKAIANFKKILAEKKIKIEDLL